MSLGGLWLVSLGRKPHRDPHHEPQRFLSLKAVGQSQGGLRSISVLMQTWSALKPLAGSLELKDGMLQSVNLLTLGLLEHPRGCPGHQEDASEQGHHLSEERDRSQGDHPLQTLHGRSGSSCPGTFLHRSFAEFPIFSLWWITEVKMSYQIVVM